LLREQRPARTCVRTSSRTRGAESLQHVAVCCSLSGLVAACFSLSNGIQDPMRHDYRRRDCAGTPRCRRGEAATEDSSSLRPPRLTPTNCSLSSSQGTAASGGGGAVSETKRLEKWTPLVESSRTRLARVILT
jgi:hypothetical protein